MRQISFYYTQPQFEDGSKDVTRRKGWKNLKVGEHLMAVRKGQGLKKGEKVQRLGEIEVLEVQREQLWEIAKHPNDCAREGFPGMTCIQFCDGYRKMNGGGYLQKVTRIVFRRVK